MDTNRSIRFFDEQFRKQLGEHDLQLNPFEKLALPHLHGRVLDYGCGLGNLSLAAARAGCEVHALDASPAAIAHLRETARNEGLRLRAEGADLRVHDIAEDYDVVVCIGLLMFFGCEVAHAKLASLMDHVRPGGVAIVNVLAEGTTFLDMFDPQGHCLFTREALQARFAGWQMLQLECSEFPAPRGTTKAFVTLIARKPAT